MTAVFHLPMPDGVAPVDVHQAAELAAEAVRAMNHLTGSPGALEYPSDVHRLLGQLDVLAGRLPQLLAQLLLFLGNQDADGHVVADYGRYAGRTDEAMADVALALAAAITSANELQAALAAAQSPCSGLSYTGPLGGGDDE